MIDKYYANYSATGEILGFYCEELHGNSIPEPNIVIDAETWQKLLEEQGRWKVDVGAKKLVYINPPAPTPEELKEVERVKCKALFEPLVDEATDRLLNAGYDGAEKEIIDSIFTERKKIKDSFAAAMKKINGGEPWATELLLYKRFCKLCYAELNVDGVCPKCGWHA